MKQVVYILFSVLLSTPLFGQRDLSKTSGDIAPIILSLKKPPKYEHHSPCDVVFINYTNVPLQVNWLHPTGRMQKLIYVDAKDTVRISSMTNHHLIVCYQGERAGAMFIPAFDINICRLHDRHFNDTKKIPKRKYKPIKGDIRVDKRFKYKPELKTYSGKAPIVYFDEAHLTNNSMERFYKPFAALLERDGYDVRPYRINFTKAGLETGKILIMSNAYGQQVNGWRVDSAQALISTELEALKEWVNEGGRLLLIMDHTPFPSRVENIAKAFGFTFMDCHVMDTTSTEVGSLFSLELGGLGDHVIMKGRNSNEEVEQIATFSGSCMRAPAQAKPIIKLDDRFVAVYTHGPWQFEQSDYRESANGLLQAAVMDYGKGKIAVFCESELFTALKNKETGDKIGMNYKYAYENPLFVLNTIHWLDGFIE